MNGNAPHIPQPVSPKKKSFKNSALSAFVFFNIGLWKKGTSKINTVVHLQKAKETGGTNSTPPLATIRLLAIKTGCKNNKKYGNIKLLLFFDEGFIKHHTNY